MIVRTVALQNFLADINHTEKANQWLKKKRKREKEKYNLSNHKYYRYVDAGRVVGN